MMYDLHANIDKHNHIAILIKCKFAQCEPVRIDLVCNL